MTKPSCRHFLLTGLAIAAVLLSAGFSYATPADLPDEDGYKLWLRYAPPSDTKVESYKNIIKSVLVAGESPTCEAIQNELEIALPSMLGSEIPSVDEAAEGTVVIGTPAESALIKSAIDAADLEAVGDEGYVIRTDNDAGTTLIAANTDIGAMYGTFHFLRLMQTDKSIDGLDITEKPALDLRLMNHWDNPNGSIERGYAGRSLWNWSELPDTIDPRYIDYARSCASLGLNGAVINNVNADTRMLTPGVLRQVKALADAWRPYGVHMYLSIKFSSPVDIGGLDTADPLEESVQEWWAAKADEIYEMIPDFGGFLVKANSEGQPGPKTYNRTHAEGANLLADALAPHNGNVIWRAFVYDADVDPDRANRAYLEFTRLEGDFRPNVVIQVKNGAIDFQPREPFHPLFGGLEQTPVIAELQPTQEYLGQARHLVYHGPMWEEFLQAETYAKGEGSTVAKVLMGEVFPYSVTGMVGVTNPGTDRNWCGHHFSQSNWYVFGRLAWNPEYSTKDIAEEWTRMTFSNDEDTVNTIVDMMMGSHETFVSYTMPLGLHHLIGGDHYAPQPENGNAPRADWTATYYHQAAKDGIGFDRTSTGSNNADQYHPPLNDIFEDPATCPEKFLLWFHHLPWDYKMKSGKTLWEELCDTYYRGASEAAELQKTWHTLEGKIDAQRFQEVDERLDIQVAHAAQWRDHILEYFQQFSEMEIPEE